MEKVDLETGEILKIGRGGLYTAFPIPAYKVLGNAGHHKAQGVLCCLISYLGKSSNNCWPSYTAITSMSGIHRSQIKASLNVLEEFGFIIVHRGRISPNRKSNSYSIKEACFHPHLMNLVAKQFLETTYMCKSCGNQVNRAFAKQGKLGRIHLGCGGETFPRKIKPLRKIESFSAEISNTLEVKNQ